MHDPEKPEDKLARLESYLAHAREILAKEIRYQQRRINLENLEIIEDGIRQLEAQKAKLLKEEFGQ